AADALTDRLLVVICSSLRAPGVSDASIDEGPFLDALAAPFQNWLGWKFRRSVLQADGSILVGLAGDDQGAKPADLPPTFCRPTPALHALDPASGTGPGLRRLPGEDRLIPGGEKRIDYQSPAALREAGGGRVIAAISCQTQRKASGTAVTGGSPDLLADGSAG